VSGAELTSASEVWDFLASDGPIADWIRASTLTDSQRIGLGYAVVADRKDRAVPMEAVAWREKVAEMAWRFRGNDRHGGPWYPNAKPTDSPAMSDCFGFADAILQALAVIPAPGNKEEGR